VRQRWWQTNIRLNGKVVWTPFFELITMLAFHWRIGLAVLVALISAVLLATNISWFTGWYGVLLVIFSFGAGLIWEGIPKD